MKITNWFILILAIVGLITVRVVEEHLFYDPFLSYFHELNKKDNFPDFQWTPLIFSHLLRFGLNLTFSTLIIYSIFRKKDWTIQGAVLMTLMFIITFPIYLYCVSTHFDIGLLFSFYIRRFVIQPIILLLIIPLFYYRRHLETTKTTS